MAETVEEQPTPLPIAEEFIPPLTDEEILLRLNELVRNPKHPQHDRAMDLLSKGMEEGGAPESQKTTWNIHEIVPGEKRKTSRQVTSDNINV
jgi:hypothetical protein